MGLWETCVETNSFSKGSVTDFVFFFNLSLCRYQFPISDLDNNNNVNNINRVIDYHSLT